MKKSRRKRIVCRRRRISEKEIMRIKRKLKKSARKLRLGAKRTGAYVYGTLRRIRGNPGARYRVGGGYKTFTLEEAKKEADRIFRTTGSIVSIVEHKPTPQVAPAWKYGIYTGRGVVRKNSNSYSIRDIKTGDRIQLHPAHSMWMRGARYGTVVGVGLKMIAVKLDGVRKYVKIAPRDVGEIYVMGRLRRNPEEYARQIPRESRPMRARGFSGGFDFSAGSTYQDLLKFVSGGRGGGFSRKIGANTYVNRYGDGSIGVILYQTRILHYHPNGDVDVNFGGYMTTTTFSRINALIPYGWRLRKKGGKLALENSWGQRAVIRKPRTGEEYAVRLTEDKAYLIT